MSAVTVHLARADARLLYGLLYDLGEHHAAGAPIAPLTDAEHRQFNRLRGMMHAVNGGEALMGAAPTDELVAVELARKDAGDIAERLDALDLYLRDGTPIPAGDRDSIERVGAVIRTLERQLAA